jgi:hypothetical protein
MNSATETSEASEAPIAVRRLIYNLRDAVVSVSYQGRNCSGFFIKRPYILCPASIMCSGPIGRVGPIHVGVSNVESKVENKIEHKSYCYQAKLVGIDGAGNLALLVIDKDAAWNKTNPPLPATHRVLEWGKSRNLVSGDRIFVIGDTVSDVFQAEGAVLSGNIADNRYVDGNGKITGELLLLSNILSVGTRPGLPVINSDGKFVGITLSGNVALSEYFMRRPLKVMVEEIEKGGCVLPVIYRKATLGIVARLATMTDLIICPDNSWHEIIGYVITRFVFQEPEDISAGDMITHINEHGLGDRKDQQAPALVMWKISAGTPVGIRYRKISEGYNIEHRALLSTMVYPELLDYPSCEQAITI